jgi:3-oxoacyl-[acyl-carrier protein] reductase
MTNRLAGKVAIITGGGHGIGKAYVRRFAEEGAKVIIAELDGPAGDALAEELTAEGHDVISSRTDVTSDEQTRTTAELAVRRFGRIDILVNNAAVFASVPMSRAPFDQISPNEWDLMMNVNLKGTWIASRSVVPQMREQKYGKIINISSGTALKGSASRIHYVTSKAGILGFTKTLANELGADNICVNCVAPGNTLSQENPDPELLKQRERAGQAKALKRVQTPEDLTGAVLFFASADSDFITGQTLVVDGGSCMH